MKYESLTSEQKKKAVKNLTISMWICYVTVALATVLTACILVKAASVISSAPSFENTDYVVATVTEVNNNEVTFLTLEEDPYTFTISDIYFNEPLKVDDRESFWVTQDKKVIPSQIKTDVSLWTGLAVFFPLLTVFWVLSFGIVGIIMQMRRNKIRKLV